VESLNNAIAGDGYFYIAYEDLTDPSVVRLMLMRVGTDGSSSQIDVKDWDTTDPDQVDSRFPSVESVGMITNADQGVVLSWWMIEWGYCAPSYYWSDCGDFYGLATTSGGSLASSVSTPTLLQPNLQAQDGTFYGENWNENGYGMVKFDPSGNIQWSVPYDDPQIATADGGVMGSSGITYDSNGNATGQITNMPIKGWFGDSYQVAGSVQSVEPIPVNPAESDWAFLGGSPSGEGGTGGGTAAKDVFKLGDPTSTYTAYNGGPLFPCGPLGIGLPPKLYKFPTYYGYQECEEYPILDINGNAIKRFGIHINESFGPPQTSPGLSFLLHPRNGWTDDNGVLWDWLTRGNVSPPPPAPGTYVLVQQTFTLKDMGRIVRVNCLDYEATDVYVTDITNNPGAPCTR